MPGIARLLRDWGRFRRDYSGTLTMMPCLHDWYDEAGAVRTEYFWQDLLVARMIFQARPHRHVDVGSRVDGFVAHVASFREIEVFDVRPVSIQVPGVVFRQADLIRPANLAADADGYCDSLSCLHALEHFGLGRYGDPVDPVGYERGFAAMSRLLKPGGRLYLSTPVGQERVEFNAHRVFDPRTIIRCAQSNGLQLHGLTVINSLGVTTKEISEQTLLELAQASYNLGLFIFTKPA